MNPSSFDKKMTDKLKNMLLNCQKFEFSSIKPQKSDEESLKPHFWLCLQDDDFGETAFVIQRTEGRKNPVNSRNVNAGIDWILQAFAFRMTAFRTVSVKLHSSFRGPKGGRIQ